MTFARLLQFTQNDSPALFAFFKSSTAHAILIFLAAFFMSRKSNKQPAFFSCSFNFFTFFQINVFPVEKSKILLILLLLILLFFSTLSVPNVNEMNNYDACISEFIRINSTFYTKHVSESQKSDLDLTYMRPELCKLENKFIQFIHYGDLKF
jgi:chromate transport protein ChrA